MDEAVVVPQGVVPAYTEVVHAQHGGKEPHLVVLDLVVDGGGGGGHGRFGLTCFKYTHVLWCFFNDKINGAQVSTAYPQACPVYTGIGDLGLLVYEQILQDLNKIF